MTSCFALAGVVVLAALSLLAPSQPGYDPWAWLLWGREVSELRLDTVDGPAFKPLPVAVAALLAPVGGAAPALWLLVARAGAIGAVLLAARLAWRLAGGSPLAGAVAGAGVALTAGWWWHAAVGNAEGLFVALVLAAFDRALDGRHRVALALALAAALIRPEAWPFLGGYGLWLWRRAPELRGALAGAAAIVPALWLLPDLWGSGSLLRSVERARIPNPGAPATADRPALASLREAYALPLLPIGMAAVGTVLAAAVALAGATRARRRGPLGRLRFLVSQGARTRQRVTASLPAVAGLAWIAFVALMAEGGSSGEPRYALPGAAALAVSAGAGAGLAASRLRTRAWRRPGVLRARLGPHAAAMLGGRGAPVLAGAAAVVAVAPFVAPRAGDVAGELRRAADQAELYGSLGEAVARAGGREALLACGRPVTGRYRGPAVAWALRVPKREVAFDPALGGAVLRSRVRRDATVQPAAPPAGRVASRSRRWQVVVRCPGPIRAVS
jgi:hypothetical protein